MIANPSFCWPSSNVVLDAVTLKYLNVTSIHFHRNRHNQLEFGVLQNVPHGVVEFEVVSRTMELLLGISKGLRTSWIACLVAVFCSLNLGVGERCNAKVPPIEWQDRLRSQ